MIHYADKTGNWMWNKEKISYVYYDKKRGLWVTMDNGKDLRFMIKDITDQKAFDHLIDMYFLYFKEGFEPFDSVKIVEVEQ